GRARKKSGRSCLWSVQYSPNEFFREPLVSCKGGINHARAAGPGRKNFPLTTTSLSTNQRSSRQEAQGCQVVAPEKTAGDVAGGLADRAPASIRPRAGFRPQKPGRRTRLLGI